MDLFTYLMAKNGQNTGKDLFSYLLGKNAGGSGTYTTFSGTSLNISNTIKAKIKKFMLNSTELTQDGTPTPDTPQDIHIITNSNNIKISDGTEEQNYSINLNSKNLFNKDNVKLNYTWNNTPAGGRSIFFIETKPNETYTISASNWNDLYYVIVYLDHIGATTIIYESGWINPSTDPSKTFTTTTGTNILGIHFKYQSTGSTVMTQAMFDNATIQLEKGSTATAYTPYYNIEYCKIGDYADQFIRTNGKNLAKPLRYGVYNANTGEYIYSTDYTCSSEPITITSNEYIFSIDGIASGGYAYEFSSSNSYLRRVYIDNTGIYTPTSDASYFQYAFKDAAVSNVPLNSNVQIEEGNTVTDFEPYGINEWYLKKNINKDIYDESGTWLERVNSAGVKQFYHNRPSGSPQLINYKQFCNYFSRYSGSVYNYGVIGDFAIFANPSQLFCCVSDDITLEDFKSKLAIENLIVYYVLATPQYIHISETDYPTLRSQLENLYNNAKSYEGTTNITQTNEDLPFNISVDVKVANL